MGGWRLESAKVLGYLLVPIAAFIYFNHPQFYEQSLRFTMENVSKDINLDNLERFEKSRSKEEIANLSSMIDEIDGNKSRRPKEATAAAAAAAGGKGM